MVCQRCWFLSGLFLTTLSALLVEVLDTRLLSVLTWYHLSFFAVSMAMFGLAAGAVRVYLGGGQFEGEQARRQLASVSIAYALSIPLLHLLVVLVPIPVDLDTYQIARVAMTALVAAVLLAVPFYLAGIVIGVALTRIPGSIGVTYAVDLIGAALGCLLAVPILAYSDISTAMFAAGTFALLGALCFQVFVGPAGKLRWTALLVPVFVGGTILNASLDYPYALRLVHEKHAWVDRADIQYEAWNSHSQVMLTRFKSGPPSYWGPGLMPDGLQVETGRLYIDGSAYTDVTRWDGDPASLSWVQYDVTSVPYHLRTGGDVGIIGVGGGRDVCTALWARSRSITGIELNGILVDLQYGRLRDFTGITKRPEVHLFHDEARSFLTRTPERFDVLQMSLIDSWASTSAGAFTLSENGLYTREGWGIFLNTLKPNGIFSTSRHFALGHPSETSRLLALCTAALLDRGVAEPSRHIALLSRHRIATLMVSPTPLASTDLERIRAVAGRYQFTVLALPGVPPEDTRLAAILASRSPQDLAEATVSGVFDFSVPTDDCPYFFNTLRPTALFVRNWDQDQVESAGVIHGNRMASAALLLLLGVSTVLVLLVIFLPLALARRHSERPPHFGAAVLYFALIGTGFMMVQIPYMQRFSVYLGHPTYAVVVILFSMILFAGLGSMLSERLPLRASAVLGVPLMITAGLSLSLTLVRTVTHTTVVYPLAARCLIVLAFAAPVSLLLGCCFPLGMRLLGRISDTATSWMWGVNGACSVLASAAAVGLSMWVSIDASLALGAACYLLLTVPAFRLLRGGTRSETAAPPSEQATPGKDAVAVAVPTA
jgi:spermidine synthase